MSNTDRIAQILRDRLPLHLTAGGYVGVPELAAAIDAELHPVIETVEQLDALPLNTVVVDAAGIPRTSRHGDSHMPGGWTHAGRSPLSSHELADGRPMRVVYNPEADRG
ncbi:hypothetical protein A5731_00525 [Mycolicibacterium conceptionense]|uniref:hypothetical protein n=1 Tax=Mycolicibacterium conceptionense TaxID=451644 RepID=UPI0007E980CD|nr:hypothetical protein [Mycolicibacterium conceptionense]OBB15485.1 hypothetical protein A5718_29915 [Mycolicibacterium conceptionense]OBF09227.1 hypothetical protein A5731_00525 [Mycolicibacterium conceptionense]